MVWHSEGDTSGAAAHQIAEWKVFGIWNKPGSVPRPGCHDAGSLILIERLKRQHGRFCLVERDDETLGDGAPLELNESQHRLIIARVACEPPHTFGCMRDDTSTL